MSATSPAERATAGPATAATRLAMVPMPYPTSWVSPPLTTTLSTGTDEDVGADLGKGRLVALPLGADAEMDEDGAAGIDVHVGALEGTEPRPLHVRAEPDADRPRRPLALRLLGAPVRILEPLDQPIEGRHVIRRVVRDRHAVAVGEPGAIGHLVGPDHVQAPERRRVHAERPRRAVEQAIEDEGGLGAPGAAIRGGEGLVGDDVRSDGAIVRHAIRPGQMIDGVLGDGLAERRERAVIPREGGLEGDDGAVARHSDPRAVILVSIRAPRSGSARAGSPPT